MNSLANKLKIQAATKLYSNRVQNMTQKELIIRSYYKSAQYIEIAMECQKNNNLKDYRDNVNKSLLIIQNLLENLVFFDNEGKTLEVASNLYAGYNFIIGVLIDGLKDNSIKNFDVCIKYLNELKTAFDSIN